MKVVVTFIYGYQKLSGEKCKTNEKRISSIGLTSLEKNPKNYPKCHFSEKQCFRVVFGIFLITGMSDWGNSFFIGFVFFSWWFLIPIYKVYDNFHFWPYNGDFQIFRPLVEGQRGGIFEKSFYTRDFYLKWQWFPLVVWKVMVMKAMTDSFQILISKVYFFPSVPGLCIF